MLKCVMNKAGSPATLSAFADLDLRPTLLGDEDPALFETFRAGLMVDLEPRTAYQRTLAENLVAIEWEALRHRRLRDALVAAAFPGKAKTALWSIAQGRSLSEAETLAHALAHGPQDVRALALAALEETRTTTTGLVAEAYGAAAFKTEPHERKLAELETRRRRMLDDYERLQALPKRRAVEDAEIVAQG